MPRDDHAPANDDPATADDVRRLHALGHAQELSRRPGGFSNFALSLSIIGILAGGVTSFHLGSCSVGGASIGLGWPLVGLFAPAGAATMGQLASTFPTAGGLYHWAAILGGRGWGGAAAWFDLAGLAAVPAAIDVGTYRFAMASRGLGPFPAELDLAAQAIGVILITGSQAAVDHLAIVATAGLTDFSGHWILLVSAALTAGLLAFAPGLNPSRLLTFANFSGSAGGGVRPETEGVVLLFAPGALWPAYTITGFDASAHASEETVGASASVPRGIVRSALVSGSPAGSCCAPRCGPRPASPGPRRRARAPLVDRPGRAAAIVGRPPVRRDRAGAVSRRAGRGDLGLADGGRLRPRRRPAVLDGRAPGLPPAPVAGHGDPGRRRGLGAVRAAHAGLFDDHRRLHDLPLRLVGAADPNEP